MGIGGVGVYLIKKPTQMPVSGSRASYWFLLHRKSNIEYLYTGKPGDISKSRLIKTFNVKSGVPGKKPTPLPELVGRKYWVITKKFETFDNPETAPYFLEFNVPGGDAEPYFGPVPYLECNGQCSWELPGPFGMHGIGDDETRLSIENEGSSGCVRHSTEDITYLYNLIDPNDNIRYYIEDI